MDIKEQIEKVVDKVKNDENFKKEFKKNPIEAVEKVSGIDIPDGMAEKLVAGVQAKLGADQASGAVDKLKKLF